MFPFLASDEVCRFLGIARVDCRSEHCPSAVSKSVGVLSLKMAIARSKVLTWLLSLLHASLVS